MTNHPAGDTGAPLSSSGDAPPSARKGRGWLWVAAVGIAILLAAGAVTAFYLGWPPGKRAPQPPPPLSDEEIAARVHNFCGACHAYPPPDTFPRKHWKEEVERGYRFFSEASLNLELPQNMDDVIRYYEQRAPEEMTLPELPRAATPLRVRFDKQAFARPAENLAPALAHVNLVHLFDDKRLDVLACEMRYGQILVLRPYQESPRWQVLGSVPHPAHAEVVDLDGDGIKDILVASLGSFPPTNIRCGSVVWLRGKGDGTFMPMPLLEGVGRVADVQVADFNGDGKLDLVVAAFGWQQTGEIYWLENKTTDWSRPTFERHLVDERHGAIHVPTTEAAGKMIDLDGDGRPDFIALISQEHETIVAYLNQGNGKFVKKTLYAAAHPGYGSSGIQVVDLNGDGKVDVLYTNGDVLDEPYFLKPYHSIQWLENKGGLRFEHHPLLTMYGVHRAVAADLDGDGDLDILAVSFLPTERFPERKEKNCDAVVVLEQTAPGRFERHVLESASCDHVSCAVGDVYGTGRQDLVIGNFTLLDKQKMDHALTIWRNLPAQASNDRRSGQALAALWPVEHRLGVSRTMLGRGGSSSRCPLFGDSRLSVPRGPARSARPGGVP